MADIISFSDYRTHVPPLNIATVLVSGLKAKSVKGNDIRMLMLEPRQRAIKVISEVYKLPKEEGEGLLNGTIPITVDEVAGTITYIIAI